VKEINQIFNVEYGVNLELNSLTICDKSNKNAVNFVSRTSKNNGVSAIVERIAGIDPIPAGTISVAGGGSVMESFLQPEPYYSGRDLYVLTPLFEMTDIEKLYYCYCLKNNKYRYNYGRQANKTLKDILVPDLNEIPNEFREANIMSYDDIGRSISMEKYELNTDKWKEVELIKYFKMMAGKYYSVYDFNEGSTPLISSTAGNNGIKNLTDLAPIFSSNCLTIGKVGCICYYQEDSFCATSDTTVLEPLLGVMMNKFSGLFLSVVINLESIKWNYGRQIRLNDCQAMKIKLPVTLDGSPDFDFMEKYIKTIKYSKSIK